MPSDTPTTPPSATTEAEREAARLQERERIARAIEDEADLTPCQEDANVTRGLATLVRADFSYDNAEAYEDRNKQLEADRDAALAREARLREALEWLAQSGFIPTLERQGVARTALAGTSETQTAGDFVLDEHGNVEGRRMR